MPPRKRAETKPEAPSVQHDDCTVPRIESYTLLGAGGVPHIVTRCMECGAQETSKG